MRRTVISVAVSLVTLLVVLLVNAVRLPSLQPVVTPFIDPRPIRSGAVERLAGALSIRTTEVAAESDVTAAPFETFHAFLGSSFPLTHQGLDVETIAGSSLLYTWRGQRSTALPIVLMAHLDVVEADDAGTTWRYPPFAGRVAEQFVWGRGALDDKSAVLATLEATESLLAESFQPTRTVYLAFGHDEESGGRGAHAILETLRGRGVTEFALVLDEGGAILPGSRIPGVGQSVALIGIGEKRVLNLELTVEATGGHASSPPRVSAIGRLSRAIGRLEADPFPARLDGATVEMFRYLAPEMSLGPKLIFSNLWLFRPLVGWVLERSPNTAPVVRTTLAPTMITAGSSVNVLPGRAHAIVNVRLLPTDAPRAAIDRIIRTVDDALVDIRPLEDLREDHDRVPLADVSSPGFALIARTVRQIYGGTDVLVAPYLTIAAVDARWYAGHSRNVYRFRGVRWEADATERIHGDNERIAVDAYLDSVRFLYRLLRNTDTL